MANVIQKAANVGQQEEVDKNKGGGNFDNSGKQGAGSGVKGDSALQGAQAEEEEEETPLGGDPGAGPGGKGDPDEKKGKEKSAKDPDKEEEEGSGVEVPEYVWATIKTLEERASRKNDSEGEGGPHAQVQQGEDGRDRHG